jgi:hypothetical protein
MNYFQAHAILDAIKDGKLYSTTIVNRALEMTGDARTDEFYEGLRSEGMDKEVQPARQQCPKLVGKNIIRNTETAWGIGAKRLARTYESSAA